MAFPSSGSVFAGLVVAWLIVLIPMASRRRHEIARSTDSALTARVLSRGGVRGNAQEVDVMPEEADVFPQSNNVDQSTLSSEDSAIRPYRRGRGGFDPEAAAMAAQAKYTFRQRVVIGLLFAAVATAFLAGLQFPILWWMHVVIDLALIGYLIYLRRQVQIEKELRQRRMARYVGAGHRDSNIFQSNTDTDIAAHSSHTSPVTPLRAMVVELDDDDPAFHELTDEPADPAYHRAAG